MQINYKRTTYILAAVLALSLLVTFSVLAGNINSSAAPGATNSYTLADIYNRLNAGTAGTQSTFTEPTTGPGSTMNDLNAIMAAAPAVDDTDGATAADVASGKTFWGLTSAAGWGEQTGTLTSAPCDCSGGMLDGTRWCDNGNNTVTDLLGDSTNNYAGQCLIWAKDASWGGTKPWYDTSGFDDAHTRASAYGAEPENWRLPTWAELSALTQGTEAVSSGDIRAFAGVQSGSYWSSTSSASYTTHAWSVYLYNGDTGYESKPRANYVWPVRGGQ